jgi:hypothetical protein
VCFLYGDGFTKGIGGAEETAEFELDVETTAGSEGGYLWVGGSIKEGLAVGSTDTCTRNDDGGGTAVVADWEMGVVWLEGIGWALRIRAVNLRLTEREAGVL